MWECIPPANEREDFHLSLVSLEKIHVHIHDFRRYTWQHHEGAPVGAVAGVTRAAIPPDLPTCVIKNRMQPPSTHTHL